ncbi:MAG: pilin [Patescibacteria group bacterium]
MGTACNADRRIIKLTAITVIVFASVWYAFAPVFVLAQEAPAAEQMCGENPKQPKCNALCWRTEQCKEKDGVFEESEESKAVCGGAPWAYCFPPNSKITLQIPIGGAEDVADMGKYVKTIYLFSLGIGGLVGAIVLIHAGFLWIVSGGNTATIERAKKHIQDAAIGLLLLFGSYTMLSAINPDLVKLRVPRAHLIRNIAIEFEPVKPGTEGGPCDVKNELSVKACRAACSGCDCYSFKESGAETLAKYTMWAVASVAGGGAVLSGVGGGSIAAGVRAVLPKLLSASKSTFGVLKKLVGLGFSHPQAGFLTAAVGFKTVSDFESWLDQQGIAMDEPGICINAPKNILNRGDLCGLDESCIQPMKCVTFIESFGGLEKGIGVCSDGTEGSGCNEATDCNNGTPADSSDDLSCVDGPLKLKGCAPLTGRAQGTYCGLGHGELADTICAAGLACKITNKEFAFTFDKVGYGFCIDAREASGDYQPQYIGDRDCLSGKDEQCPEGLQCKSWQPNARESCNRICDSDQACQDFCPPGETCHCRNEAPRICRKGALVVQALNNGSSGCDNPARPERQCAQGLVCVGPIEALQEQKVCTNGANGSWCSNYPECASKNCQPTFDEALEMNITRCAACRNNEDCLEGQCRNGVCG